MEPGRWATGLVGLVLSLAVATGCSSLEAGSGALSTTTTAPAADPSTTSAPTTTPPATTMTIGEDDDVEVAGAVQEPDGALPRTGPSEAAVLAAAGLGLILVGRLTFDALAVLERRQFAKIEQRSGIPR